MEATKVCKSCGRELPIGQFGVSHLGTFSTCRECVRKHQAQAHQKRRVEKQQTKNVEAAKRTRLSEFTPRELMAELKRRGYEYTMRYVETHVINSKDIEV